ncbi:MAG TPA: hypothetical protein VGK26_01790 [Thermoanaerobaculia bacterium]|jgi:hypothetical protein
MNLVPLLFPILAASASAAAPASLSVNPAPAPSAAAPADEPLACRLDALSPAQRARHQKLTALLQRAVAGTRELPDGYEFALDLSRLPADAQGDPVCVVEIAEWVDLEARCCPFLDFGIAVRGKGPGSVALTLTGGPGVKEFLTTEVAPALKGDEKKLQSRP